MIYLITYELRSKRSYQQFYDAIKSYDFWAHYIDQTWFIKTHESPKEIYAKLRPKMESSDSLFIAEINTSSGHYYGILNKNAWEWIGKNR